ncbi:hypothetical protein [Candidatus Chloroploca asiatica]|uniref:Uncharacterized protein n=1 Tax=Candidatus Chloroploca asiatica TaxID=1506545 RepID=A0A2H3L253_9CHLR|nr:hypothetical protein [Candidatus Chloroploca asiatica]PDW00573.1 hypothetical protein A9Q02_09285 [Candidatus Chloroploca asiatica]
MVEHLLDVVRSEPGELKRAYRWNDVVLDVLGILGVRSHAHLALDGLLKPGLQELRNGLLLRRQIDAGGLVAMDGLQFGRNLFAGLPVDHFARALAIDQAQVDGRAPLAVAVALVDGPFSVAAPLSCRCCVLTNGSTLIVHWCPRTPAAHRAA